MLQPFESCRFLNTNIKLETTTYKLQCSGVFHASGSLFKVEPAGFLQKQKPSSPSGKQTDWGYGLDTAALGLNDFFHKFRLVVANPLKKGHCVF